VLGPLAPLAVTDATPLAVTEATPQLPP